MPWKMFEPQSVGGSLLLLHSSSHVYLHQDLFATIYFRNEYIQLNESVQKSVEMNGGVHTKLKINCTELEK